MSSVDKVALDYFDASINRISAWVVGFRNFQKALLNALLTPNETLKQLQDEGRMTELMEKQENCATELEEKEERWMYLNELAEQMGL